MDNCDICSMFLSAHFLIFGNRDYNSEYEWQRWQEMSARVHTSTNHPKEVWKWEKFR
jgi:hypothetical protein